MQVFATQARTKINGALVCSDIEEIGAFYPRESLCWEVGRVFGLGGAKADQVFPDRVLRALRAESSSRDVKDALLAYLPSFVASAPVASAEAAGA